MLKYSLFILLFLNHQTIAAPDQWESDQFGGDGFRTLRYNVQLTQQYRELCYLPQTPVLHTYNPQGLYVVAAVKRPTDQCLQYAPKPFERALTLENVTPDRIDIFYVAQNFLWGTPFNVDGQPYLLRPQGWTFPNCPTNGKETHQTPIDAVIMNAAGTATFADTKHTIKNIYENQGITSHPEKKDQESRMISSGDTHKIAALKAGTQTLWSLVHDRTTHRIAITLHHLFSPADAESIGAQTRSTPPNSFDAYLGMIQTQDPDVHALLLGQAPEKDVYMPQEPLTEAIRAWLKAPSS